MNIKILIAILAISSSLIPALASTVVNGEIHSAKAEKTKAILRDSVYTTVDEMPRFPGCENEDLSPKRKTECAQNKLLEYLYRNLIYPENARENEIEGTTVVQFVVEKNGQLSDINVIKDIGGGCGAESNRVIASMNKMDNLWRPGLLNGEAVRVKYTLPIKYKLTDVLHLPRTPNASDVYKIVENMPRFPGCEDLDARISEKEKCSQKEMLKYIYANLKYPIKAKEAKRQGTVVISFVINKLGKLDNIQIARDDAGYGCGKAARLVIESMNQMEKPWISGVKDDKPVNVSYMVPVKFKL